MKIAVFVSGGGTNLQKIIDAIEKQELSHVEIGLVVASNPNAYAIQRAQLHQIPCRICNPKDFASFWAYEEELLQILSSTPVDIIVLAGFLSKIGERIIQQFSYKIINIHPSLLPAFSGAGMYGIKPHLAALERGVKITGATVHFVTLEYDAGPIILQKAIPVKEEDTAHSLQTRVMVECEQVILPQALQLLSLNKIEIIHDKVHIKGAQYEN